MKPVQYFPSARCREEIQYNLDTHGVCVVAQVLNKGQINKALDLTWDLLTEMSPTLDRNRPSTWTTANRPDDQGGMIQSMAGWTPAQMYVRKRASKVFKLIYDTEKLDCSADGISFSGLLKSRRSTPNKKVHFDAGETQHSTSIQGVVNLITQNDGDACWGGYPGSHLLHKDIAKGKRNFYPLTPEDKGALEAHGLKYVRITLQAGEMILFRSQVAHHQAHPIKLSIQKPRIVHYVCCMPVCDNLQKRRDTMVKKRMAYDANRATSHYPNYSVAPIALFSKDLGKGPLARYKRDISQFKKAKRMPIEEMSDRTKKLMSLTAYDA
jgi:hypothetical protein